jgi:hypothetical protein
MVFVKVTSPKMSSKVVPWNKSSNNFLNAMFLLKSGKTMALIKLFEELFNICRATYTFGTTQKFFSLSFHYLEHLCIPPIFAFTMNINPGI